MFSPFILASSQIILIDFRCEAVSTVFNYYIVYVFENRILSILWNLNNIKLGVLKYKYGLAIFWSLAAPNNNLWTNDCEKNQKNNEPLFLGQLA